MTEEIPQNGDGRGQERLDVTRALAVLSDAQRRFLLYYMIEEADGVADVEDLAAYLEMVGFGTGATDAGLESRLHHQHLPKMAEAGVVEYDDLSATVKYQSDELVEGVLSVVADYDRIEDG